MDTIMSYLETMFARLPKTPEVERIKQELEMNMEEKYHELIADGKTENEAVGTVISEFGNIDELTDELGYQDTAYQKLLQGEDYNDKKEEEEDKVIGAVASVVWPLAVVVFLITGLIFDLWQINWIIFPITGLLFGAFAGVRGILNDK